MPRARGRGSPRIARSRRIAPEPRPRPRAPARQPSERAHAGTTTRVRRAWRARRPRRSMRAALAAGARPFDPARRAARGGAGGGSDRARLPGGRLPLPPAHRVAGGTGRALADRLLRIDAARVRPGILRARIRKRIATWSCTWSAPARMENGAIPKLVCAMRHGRRRSTPRHSGRSASRCAPRV